MTNQAKIEHQPFPVDAFYKIIGGNNWVLHPRTKRIVERYGEDVICLSRKRYEDAERLAWLSTTEGLD